jgi:lauroyl/myristoyl acyltransferase
MIRLCGVLPWRAAQFLGASLGAVWFHLVRIRRGVVAANLRRAFPQLTGVERRDIARRAYRNTGCSVIEILRTATMTREEIAARVVPRGLEHYEEANAVGRGVIVVTAHYGNFDLLACSQAARGVPLAIVSRDLSARGANAVWMETRAASGLKIFRDRGDAMGIVRWLSGGGRSGSPQISGRRRGAGGFARPSSMRRSGRRRCPPFWPCAQARSWFRRGSREEATASTSFTSSPQ